MYQDFQYPSAPPWSTKREETSQEALGLERIFPSGWFDIHGAEIAELREKVENLEKRFEERGEQQIVPIQFLDSNKIELKKPIYVSLNYGIDDQVWIVDCPEINTYGSGQDETEAIKDFKIVLEEKYFDLKQDKDKLGQALKDEWSILSKVIKEK